jgi:hypothetical protein
MPAALITEIVQLGPPVEHRGVVIAPVFPRRQPVAEYVTADVAIPLGLTITEVDTAGSVPELRVLNPLEVDVLLYDGEELLGAKQNRILNVTVLIGAQSEAVIPVSCVEQGRWSARSATFSAAPHTAYPELRRRKAERLSVAPLERGSAQGVVWDSVREKASRNDIHSATGAQADIYRGRAGLLDALAESFPLAPGQSGALLALGSHVTLDWVSRPDAWQRLYPRVLSGYLLDAIERLDSTPALDSNLEEFVAAVARSVRSRRASAARGDDVRLRADRVIGSALEVEGELVQLSAFSTLDGSPPIRVARPSRRR